MREQVTDKIYIILPVHNRKEITSSFMSQLKDQTFSNFHLILVDDGSTDGTEEMVRKEFPSCTVIRGNGNWWWAGSLQQGYDWLKSQSLPMDSIVLIMNDDTYFEHDFLERAVAFLKKRNRTLLAPVCHYSKTDQIQNVGIHVDWRRLSFEQARSQDQINCLTTRALFLRLSDFIEIGGFYPKLLPHYFSDYEFTIRAHSIGMKLMTERSLKLRINEETTGYCYFDQDSFCQFQKKIFSKKSIVNPATWILFVIMACPIRLQIINILRILFGHCKLQIRQLRLVLKKYADKGISLSR